MTPILSLEATWDVRLPEESTEIILLISNPGTEPLKTDLPNDGWWTMCRFLLKCPDSTAIKVYPFPIETIGSVDEGPLIISEGAEIEKSFILEGLAKVDTPGWYRLEGVLETEGRVWKISPVRWFVEGPRSSEIAIPNCHGVTEMHEITCWTLFHGERLTCLSCRSIVKHDVSSSTPMGLFSQERKFEPDTDACGLVAMENMLPHPSPKTQWVAWLSGNTLQAGVAFVFFNTVSFALPAAPYRILPKLLPNTNGGTDVFVLREDGRELWVVGIDGPELKPEPSTNQIELDEEESELDPLQDETETSEEEFVADNPRTRVLMPAPKLIASLDLPCQCFKGAVARMFFEEKRTAGVLLTSQKKDDIVAFYAVVTEGGLASKWHSVVISGAQLLPDADPAIVFDPDNIARAAVLFQTCPADDSLGRLGIAHLAFGPEGSLLYVDGIGRQDLIVLPDQPVTAGLAYFMDYKTGERRCDWCVVFPGNTCLICRGNNKPEKIESMDEIIVPPALLPALEYTALATRTPEGALSFEGIG